MSKHVHSLIEQFKGLEEHEKIDFLTWVYANERHKYDYATMSESLRKFHNPKASREVDSSEDFT